MVQPANLGVGEALYVVFARPRSAALLGLLVVVAVVRLALRAGRAVLLFGGVAVAVVGPSLKGANVGA